MSRVEFNTYDDCLQSLYQSLAKAGNKQIADGMARYMKYQFVYFGIKSPVRKKIFAEYRPSLIRFIQNGFLEPILLQLWEGEERELQYCGLDLLFASKKYWTAETIHLIERLVISKSWWDTVDTLAGKNGGLCFLKFPENKSKIVATWIKSPNMWLNRSAIIHQLNYKEKTNVPLLISCIKPHIHAKEFFLRKAIGWALRQYSRTDPNEVIKIVEDLQLTGLSKREALRLCESKNKIVWK